MDGDDNNWDLYAVVRGCRSSATRDPLSKFSAEPEVMVAPEILFAENGGKGSSFTGNSDRFVEFDSTFRELEELCRPFYFPSLQKQLVQLPEVKTLSPASTSAAAVGASGIVKLLPQQQTGATHHRLPQRVLTGGQIPRSKRRKNQQKKVVCQVPAEELSSDMWAWRKYGQKPIKGSPYPRVYYRCSSSKACLARKQVERNRTDPKLFIVTYTAEHNHPMPVHRNSLAGISRQKSPPTTTEDGCPKNAVLSPVASPMASGLSPTTPLTASMDEEGMFLLEDMEVMGDDEFLFVADDDDNEVVGHGAAVFAPLWGEEQ